MSEPRERECTRDDEPSAVVCAWCPAPARGTAWHNDGLLHPSCGQIDHGQGWVPPERPPHVGAVLRSLASDAAYRAYVEGDGVTLATRDLTNAITDAVLIALGFTDHTDGNET